MRKIFTTISIALILLPASLHAQRIQQPLGRGVVAVYGRSNGSAAVEITWRRLAQEPENAQYNVYVSQSQNGGYSKLNIQPLSNTNLSTTLAQVPYGSYVAVSILADGKESPLSKPFLFKDNGLRNLYMEISYDKSPLDKSKYTTKFVWPCDLNGDGEYDYVVDRCPVDESRNYYVEGYLADGSFLWNIDLGVNEKPCDGQNDNMCAYDIDCDGFGELIVQTSDGTRFWDSTNGTWGKYLLGKDSPDSDGDGIIDYDTQSSKNPPRYMTVVDGLTGTEKASVEFMYDDAYNRTNKAYLAGDEYNKHEAHVGIAYLDGIHPAIVGEWCSRRASDKVHMYRNCAFQYVDGQWRQLFMEKTGGEVFHMIRIFDADGDGRDEMSSGAYVMDHDGSTLYNTGISHGDRHRTSDIDPERPGLETFSIQQNAPDMLGMILFDAGNGEPVKKWHLPAVGDVGRGECLDLDPDHIGWEMFSTMDNYQIYDAKGNKIDGKLGYFPTEGIWWDGQLDRENVNSPDGNGYSAMIVDYKNGRLIEMAKESDWTIKSSFGKRGKFWGDIIGDWREELILIRERDGICDGIVGFTSDYKTDIDNIYCLQEDPHYRGDCTTRGYYQTPNPGFYLGYDMPRPQLPPCMLSDDETDVFGIASGDAIVTPRQGIKKIYAMPVKGQNLTLEFGTIIPEGANTEIWKGQQGTLHLPQCHSGDLYITEGTITATSLFGTVNLRARGTLANAVYIDSLSCEGALNYEGCRLMPEGKMHIEKINLPKGKKLYIEMSPGNDSVSLAPSCLENIHGEIVFTIKNELVAGKYLLMEGINISTDQCQIRGLSGIAYHLEIAESTTGSESNPVSQLLLVVNDKREASEGVLWTGAENDIWDYQAKNFSLNGQATTFVDGDGVIFNDNAERTTITLPEMMPVTSAIFNGNSKEYIINGTGGISGRTVLKSGKVTVKEMNFNFEIGNATLMVNNSNASCENPILLTDSANILIPSGTTSLKGKISGEGTLIKSGNGQLNITYAGSNAWKETILQSGTLAMGAWNTTFGGSSSSINVKGNSTIVVFNNNSTSQVPQIQNTINIDAGIVLTLHAGKRCSIKGKLQGKGTYKIDFPYVRGDVYTNCSQFEGVYNVTTSNCRFVQAIDLSKATLKIEKDAEVVSMKAGSGSEQNLTHKVGILTGAGALGNGVWNVSNIVYSAAPTIIKGTVNLNNPTIDLTALTSKSIPDNAEFQILSINGNLNLTGTSTIIPASPKEGWQWDASTFATDGIIRIIESAGISDIEMDPNEDLEIYTVNGIKIDLPLSDPSLKGMILIVNGKKILNK